ncbi:MAG TPA: glycosyltransferase family 4 protein [Terriglobales bacterium]|nr:glycosyltransferase family 4 protein [Terriglobales bacterium]
MTNRFESIAVENRKVELVPWVLVAGGFHSCGGMDKANGALAAFLLERKTPLHLVTHQVDPEFSEHPGVRVHLVPRPAKSFFLGEWFLDRTGRAVAQKVVSQWPRSRVVVNGGNCIWPDINWVHYVHHAYTPRGAPVWSGARHRITAAISKRREQQAISSAKLVLANSNRTRSDLIRNLGVNPGRVHIIYLGADPSWCPPTPQETSWARSRLRQDGRPLVVFVGALGHDQRKGFDILWSVWRALCGRLDWDANLVVVGDGRRLGRWQSDIAASGLSSRVRLLGFTNRVRDVLAAADLLVSPARYEPFGLNVQEAICRGVPALASRSVGVAERYPVELSEMLLPDPEDIDDLAARLLRWRSHMSYWKNAFQPFSNALRSYTWKDMARRVVEITECGDHGSADALNSLSQASGADAVAQPAPELNV